MNLLGSNPEPRNLTMLPWLSLLSTLTSVSNSDTATDEFILSALMSLRITFFIFHNAVYIWQLELSIRCSIFSKSFHVSTPLSTLAWGYVPVKLHRWYWELNGNVGWIVIFQFSDLEAYLKIDKIYARVTYPSGPYVTKIKKKNIRQGVEHNASPKLSKHIKGHK